MKDFEKVDISERLLTIYEIHFSKMSSILKIPPEKRSLSLNQSLYYHKGFVHCLRSVLSLFSSHF